jgi:hypothetical protein
MMFLAQTSALEEEIARREYVFVRQGMEPLTAQQYVQQAVLSVVVHQFALDVTVQ